MKRIVLALGAVISLSACAHLEVRVDIFDPGTEDLAETATAQNFRAFAKFFCDKESHSQELIGQIEKLILQGIETCFEGGDIKITQETYKSNFKKALAKRNKFTENIANIIANVLRQNALPAERGALSPNKGTKKSPTDTEIRVARLQIIPLLKARNKAFDPFIKVLKNDLAVLSQQCGMLGDRKEKLEKAREDVEEMAPVMEIRSIDQTLVNVAEVITVIGGADPNAPRLVRENAIWHAAFNKAHTFSGLSKSQFVIVQESLTDYRIKTVTSNPEQVFNAAMEIGKQVAKTVSAIYGFPLPTGPKPVSAAGGTSEITEESGAVTGLMLDQQTRVLRAQEERIANLQRILRRDLESALATLKGKKIDEPSLKEAKAKIQGSIDRALRKLEVELAVSQPQ